MWPPAIRSDMMKMRVMMSVAVLVVASAGALWAEGGASAIVPHVRLPMGEVAPEILATTTEGVPVTLASLRGKPVVLQFGSITEPLFRVRVGASEKLAVKYADQVHFLVIYTRESHAADGVNAIDENEVEGFDIAEPANLKERMKLAQQAMERLGIKKQQVVVDAWSNTTALRYGNYPNMTFILDAQGKLQAGYPWMDPKKAQGALDALLANKPVPEEDRGSVHRAGTAAPDFGSVAMEMTGYGPGAKLAVVIDHLKLTDQEKAGLMPALSQYLVDARDYRETRSGVVLKPGVGGGGATTAPAKPATAEELDADLQKLRQSAQNLKQACQASLPPDQAKEILDALSQGPARRLFE
jgi:hypothetical protein